MLKNIGFIGLGNMGIHMATNLIKAGYNVSGFDINKDIYDFANEQNIKTKNSIKETVSDSQIIITMLTEGRHVDMVWLEVIKFAKAKSLIVDCSTIDINTSKKHMN